MWTKRFATGQGFAVRPVTNVDPADARVRGVGRPAAADRGQWQATGDVGLPHRAAPQVWGLAEGEDTDGRTIFVVTSTAARSRWRSPSGCRSPGLG